MRPLHRGDVERERDEEGNDDKAEEANRGRWGGGGGGRRMRQVVGVVVRKWACNWDLVHMQ